MGKNGSSKGGNEALHGTFHLALSRMRGGMLPVFFKIDDAEAKEALRRMLPAETIAAGLDEISRAILEERLVLSGSVAYRELACREDLRAPFFIVHLLHPERVRIAETREEAERLWALEAEKAARPAPAPAVTGKIRRPRLAPAIAG